MSEAFKAGKTDAEIELLRADFENIYAERIKGLDPDLLQFLKFNVAGTDDENKMIQSMFNKIDSQMLDPSKIYNRPQKEADTTSLFATDLGNRVALDPASFFNRLGSSTGYQGIKLNNDLTVSFQRPVESKDSEGKTVTTMQADFIDLKNPADFEAYARSIFDQFGGSEIGIGDRTQAYTKFRSALQNGITTKMAEIQKQQELEKQRAAEQPLMGPQEESEQQLSTRDQILNVTSYKPNQEIPVAEKKKMTSAVQKRILTELAKQKLDVTYANYDRMAKFLEIDNKVSFQDKFFGVTKSDEDLLAVNI